MKVDNGETVVSDSTLSEAALDKSLCAMAQMAKKEGLNENTPFRSLVKLYDGRTGSNLWNRYDVVEEYAKAKGWQFCYA